MNLASRDRDRHRPASVAVGLLLAALTPALSLAAATTPAAAQSPDRDPIWPLTIASGGQTLTLYTPQLDSWDGRALTARIAVGVSNTGTSPTQTRYGVINVEGTTLTNKEDRTVTIDNARVTGANFPSASQQEAAAWQFAISSAFAGKESRVPLDQFEAQLALTGAAAATAGTPLRNEPPHVIFVQSPAHGSALSRGRNARARDNVYTGNFAAGGRGVATGPGGNVVVGRGGVAGNVRSGDYIAGGQGAYYNKDTGEWTTFGGHTGDEGGRIGHIGDNVYAGKDGNVYRHTDSGGWEKHTSNGWESVPGNAQGQATRDATGGLGASREIPSQLPHDTGMSLDREQQSRDLGASRYHNMRDSSRGLNRAYGGRRPRMR